MEEVLSLEDIERIRTLREKLSFLELQKYAGELELKNAILQIYLKYKLGEKDKIEESTGKIIREE